MYSTRFRLHSRLREQGKSCLAMAWPSAVVYPRSTHLKVRTDRTDFFASLLLLWQSLMTIAALCPEVKNTSNQPSMPTSIRRGVKDGFLKPIKKLVGQALLSTGIE